MSLLYGQKIREQLERDIIEAWPDVTRVVFGKPMPPEPRAPYARVDSPEVEFSAHTMPMSVQKYVFVIGIVAPYPTDGRVKVIDLQEERANRLISRLMAARTYSEVNAYAPKVNRVLFGQDETEEPTYEVGVEFECNVPVAYIVNDTVLDNSTMNPSVTPLGAD